MVQEEPPAGKKQLRNQLAAAVRSIDWSYAIFWSVSGTHPGVLTWRDGFYNGEVKTRKVITVSTALTEDDQPALRRSEQLRELYETLLCADDSGGHARPPRPVASLTPEDLGDSEWFYVVCMTYAFHPGQGLPGKSWARKEHVWLRNAHLADNKTFQRAILAKSASIQTIVCIPLADGVLELGSTDSVSEDPDMLNRSAAPFRALQSSPAACTEEPSSSPSADDVIVLEDIIDHTAAMEPTIAGRRRQDQQQQQQLCELAECLSDANLEQITREIDELYALCEELDDTQPAGRIDDDWIVSVDDDGGGGLLEVVPSSSREAAAAAAAANCAGVTWSFVPWRRPEPGEVALAAAPRTTTAGVAQKLLKKVVAGGGCSASRNGGGGSTTRTAATQESGVVKSHVISERRRREKLNEMFLVLKSLIPSTHKVDKASILLETIAYLKELERRVQELQESSGREEPLATTTTTRPQAEKPTRGGGGGRRRQDDGEIAAAGASKGVAGAKRKATSSSELGGGGHDEQRGPRCRAVSAEDDDSSRRPSSAVSITVVDRDREVLVDVRCPWTELLMARVFDAVTALRLDVLSVQSSTLNGITGLKIQARFAGTTAAFAPGMISEALQKAISSNKHWN